MTGQLFKQFKYQIFLFLSGFFIFISASNCTKNPFFGLEPTPNDKEGPEINLINPTPNQKVSGFFTVIGTTSDKYEVKSVEIKIDNGNYITANGTVTFHIEINTQELTEGTHTLTVKSTDNTGNARLISRDFIVDQSVPDVDITMDYDLYQNYLKGVQVILSGTASDKNGLSNDRIGVSKVQISFNGGVVFNDTVLSADGKSWTYTIADTSTLKPGDGDLTLVLKAIDSAGLIGTSNSPLWVDNTNPSLSITSPVDGNAYIYGNDLTVLGTCSDNITNGIKEIRITIGSLAPELISCGTDGNFSITKDVSSLSSYPITAIIIDKAGNQKQTAINPVFEKRVKKPAFLTDPGTYSEAKSIVLSVDTTGAVIRYTLDGTTPNCTTTPVYSSAISLFSTKTIQAIACKDGFVNSEILSGTFTINDTGLPSIEFINPTVDQKVSGLVSFIGKTSDNIGVTLVEYKIDNGSYSPASGTLVWYFVLDTSSLSEGSHTMTIRATDGHGNSSEEQQTFIVDQTIPSVAVNLNYNLYENYIRGTNRTLSGTASDNNGVSKVQISFNGGVSFFDTILADGGTTWSYLIPNTASLIPGDASITAVLRVVDVTGIIGTVYFPLIIDNTNPGGAILSPVNNISIDGSADLNSYNLVVSGSCTDNTASGVKNVVITVGPLSSDTVSCGGDNTFSFSKNILSIKNNGPISVSALITDKSGNTNTFTNYIALDDSPPYFTGNLTTPKGILNNDLTKSANNFKSGTYVIQGRVTDETAADMLTTISEIKFKIDTIPATTPLVETLIDNYIKDQELPDDDDSLNNGKSIDSSGNWSHQFDTSAIPDGTYLITLTVKNNRGGFGTFQKTIRIDKTIPSLSDVAPVENAKISGTAVSISGYADSTGSDIASIRIQINDGTVINADYETDKFFNFTDYTNFTYAGGYFSWIWDTTSPYNYPVSATKHTIVLTAEDLAGNQGLFTVNVEKNAAAPLISFTEYDHPTNSAYIQKPLTNGRYINGSGKIRGTASVQVGGASLTSIQIKIDNGSWVDISGASFVEPDLPSASTVWEYTLPGLLPGSRKIYISAVDNLGNANTVTFQVLVDNTNPLIPSFNLSLDDGSGTSYYHGTVNIAGTASDSGAGVETAVVSVNENPGTEGDADALSVTGLESFQAVWNTHELPKIGINPVIAQDGIKVEAKVTDKAGNISSSSHTVHVRPYISSVSKNYAYLGESGLIINGHNFKDGSTLIKIGSLWDTTNWGGATGGSLTVNSTSQMTFSLGTGTACVPDDIHLKSGQITVTSNGVNNAAQTPVKMDLYCYTDMNIGNNPVYPAMTSDGTTLKIVVNNDINKYQELDYISGGTTRILVKNNNVNTPKYTHGSVAYSIAAQYVTYWASGGGVDEMRIAKSINDFSTLVFTKIFSTHGGKYSAVRVNPLDEKVHLVYYDGTNKTLNYYSSTDGFATLAADSGTILDGTPGSTDVGKWCNMALDSSGNPHVVYYDALNSNLKYIYYNGSVWSTPFVVDSENAGNFGIGITVAGSTVHISYFDGYSGDLKYAYGSGTSFTKETIDPLVISGFYSSIVLDGSGNPHISYVDFTNYRPKYAFKTASGWKVNFAAAPGYAAMNNNDNYSSIIKDSNGTIHMLFSMTNLPAAAANTLYRVVYLAEN